ncbi:MAG: alpha/beta hydrolase [Flavimaricola sp.]|nr:alpha/beta hydrolase [Flavimaricola sp.]
MTVLAIDEWFLPEDAALLPHLDRLPPHAPIVIMIHGFRYAPGQDGHDPRDLLFSLTPDMTSSRVVSWPRHLRMAGDAGLALGFGWNARGAIWQAHRHAASSATRLATLITQLRRLGPDRPVHILAHSLGARVALTALTKVGAGDISHVILIAAAVFQREARLALQSPAGQSAQILNVTGRENTLFDWLLRAALPHWGATLGRGLNQPGNWIDLPLDREATLTALARAGYRIGPVLAPICHWSGYLRPGVFDLYQAVFDGRLSPATLTLVATRQQDTVMAVHPIRTVLAEMLPARG